jgi:hypothetical protein
MMNVSALLLQTLVVLLLIQLFFLEIVIGFEEPSYAIVETGGQQQVCAVIISGNLRTTVAVEFSTADGSASGKCSDSLPYFNGDPPFSFMSSTKRLHCNN